MSNPIKTKEEILDKLHYNFDGELYYDRRTVLAAMQQYRDQAQPAATVRQWDYITGEVVARVDRILRDKGMSNVDVSEAIETVMCDLTPIQASGPSVQEADVRTQGVNYVTERRKKQSGDLWCEEDESELQAWLAGHSSRSAEVEDLKRERQRDMNLMADRENIIQGSVDILTTENRRLKEENEKLRTFTEWLALKPGLWFNDNSMLWEIPDMETEEWRREYGEGFPEDQFRFTTPELLTIYLNQ